MDARAFDALEELLRAERDRPFGNAQIGSDQINSDVSQGLQRAAENLLARAVQATVGGEPDRARHYVERAIELPFDEYEEVDTAWWATEMLIFTKVTDALEDGGEADTAWLDAAEKVLPGAQASASLVLRGSLAAIVHDYELAPRELRRCRSLADNADPNAWDEGSPAEPGDRIEAILAVVRLAVVYDAELARHRSPQS
jgi:hypothetical protein